MDIRLDANHDIDLGTEKALTLVSGAEGVRQHMLIRFQFFLGEWFRDERVGVAWFQTILKKGTPPDTIRSILRRTASQTPGVRTISKFETVFSAATRQLSVEVEGLLEPGVEPGITGAAPFQFSYSPFILGDQEPSENRGIT